MKQIIKEKRTRMAEFNAMLTPDELIRKIEDKNYREVEAYLRDRKKTDVETVIYAVALSEQKKWDEAEKVYVKLLRQQPKNFDARNNLGNIYLNQKLYQKAYDQFTQALLIGQDDETHFARACINASVAAHNLGLFNEERLLLVKARERHPEWILVKKAWAVRLIYDKEYIEAEKLLLEIIKTNSKDLEAILNLSAVYGRLKDWEKSLQYAEQVLHETPKNSIALANKGISLNGLGRYEEAKDYLLRAQATKIEHPIVYQSLAQVSLNLDEEYLVAREWCEKAYALDPEDPTINRTMGDIVARIDRTESIKWLERAYSLDPTDKRPLWHAALNYLASGHFKEGWERYELGLQIDSHGRGLEWDFGCPRWEGQNLAGKSIAIWGEQGVGDVVMFAHTLNDILAVANKAIIFVTQRLMPVFHRSFDKAVILSYEQYEKVRLKGIKFDYHSPIGGLMRYTRLERSDFVAKTPYLFPEKHYLKNYRSKYRRLANGRSIIGIAWKAGHYELAKRKKTIGLEAFRNILNNRDYFFVSFQYGDVKTEVTEFNLKYGTDLFYDETVDGLADLEPWFAQICSFDNIISVATAGVHFAGAAGKKANVLIPRNANFNWQETDLRSLWYPQINIFRQEKRGDWSLPLERLNQIVYSGQL
jgi:tetratricopeptide (TPR) repeat protein